MSLPGRYMLFDYGTIRGSDTKNILVNCSSKQKNAKILGTNLLSNLHFYGAKFVKVQRKYS